MFTHCLILKMRTKQEGKKHRANDRSDNPNPQFWGTRVHLFSPIQILCELLYQGCQKVRTVGLLSGLSNSGVKATGVCVMHDIWLTIQAVVKEEQRVVHLA